MKRIIFALLAIFSLFGAASAGTCVHGIVEQRIVPVCDHWELTYFDRCGCCTTVKGAHGQALTELLDAPAGWEWCTGWRRVEWRPDRGLWMIVDNGTVTWLQSL